MTDSQTHNARLERGRSVWDRWSDHYKLSESDFEPMRETALSRLDLQPGDRVLEVGCGPGVNFELIRSEIGTDGELVAVDYSPGMLESARERIEAHGWENLTLRRADATTADLGEGYDAAVGTLTLSVMPDVDGAIENVYDSLAPGGSFVVFDLRPVPSGPLRIVNPLLRRALYWIANWNREENVLEALAETFDRVELVETYGAGVAYTVLARKRDPAEDSRFESR